MLSVLITVRINLIQLKLSKTLGHINSNLTCCKDSEKRRILLYPLSFWLPSLTAACVRVYVKSWIDWSRAVGQISGPYPCTTVLTIPQPVGGFWPHLDPSVAHHNISPWQRRECLLCYSLPFSLSLCATRKSSYCMLSSTETYPSATRHRKLFSPHHTRQSFKRNLIELNLFVFSFFMNQDTSTWGKIMTFWWIWNLWLLL